jgi:hypothetical protein
MVKIYKLERKLMYFYHGIRVIIVLLYLQGLRLRYMELLNKVYHILSNKLKQLIKLSELHWVIYNNI